MKQSIGFVPSYPRMISLAPESKPREGGDLVVVGCGPILYHEEEVEVDGIQGESDPKV